MRNCFLTQIFESKVKTMKYGEKLRKTEFKAECKKKGQEDLGNAWIALGPLYPQSPTTSYYLQGSRDRGSGFTAYSLKWANRPSVGGSAGDSDEDENYEDEEAEGGPPSKKRRVAAVNRGSPEQEEEEEEAEEEAERENKDDKEEEKEEEEEPTEKATEEEGDGGKRTKKMKKKRTM